MSDAQVPEAYAGRTAVDSAGAKIGIVEEVYVNDASGRPDWVSLSTGLFGRDRFAPLHRSSIGGEDLVLPFSKDVLTNSPAVYDTYHLGPDESDSLFTYYRQYLDAGAFEQGGSTRYVAGGDCNAAASD